jgi:hypothetical protein
LRHQFAPHEKCHPVVIAVQDDQRLKTGCLQNRVVEAMEHPVASENREGNGHHAARCDMLPAGTKPLNGVEVVVQTQRG